MPAGQGSERYRCGKSSLNGADGRVCTHFGSRHPEVSCRIPSSFEPGQGQRGHPRGFFNIYKPVTCLTMNAVLETNPIWCLIAMRPGFGHETK
ncbi:hypothetical protein DPEC_G00345110 [Dallia pectoralis]|uniref:Uncharacterized protein n=1 Tax=Dallia pectoralis TaxID=75939 RepID=A0ACC2F3E6_DALPE|nr:hypothetical protein DPEC_G00345110 [Dallia pectoralis]